jgi:hypothetical protein
MPELELWSVLLVSDKGDTLLLHLRPFMDCLTVARNAVNSRNPGKELLEWKGENWINSWFVAPTPAVRGDTFCRIFKEANYAS